MNDPIDNQEYQGFKVSVLREAFTKIEDKTNWKLPIYTCIPYRDFDLYNAASMFFTGSPLKNRGWWGDGKVCVYGAGYYGGIGASELEATKKN